LHSDYHLSVKPIRVFMERFDVKDHLRPLADDTDLPAAVLARGELYRRLCVAIWSRERLGFPSAPAETTEVMSETVVAPAPSVPAQQVPRSRPTDIQMMIRKGVLAPGTPVIGHADGADTTAEIQPDGQLRLSTGDTFRRADDAARAVTGKKTEGMPFWHVMQPDGTRISLRQLRNETSRRRAMPKS
jgi:hypothetical protein